MPSFQQDHISINYQVFGSGKKTFLCFHGFSRESSDYGLYEPYLQGDVRLVSIDLFYHGKTKIDGRKLRTFSKTFLHELYSNFLDHLSLKKFSVLGYSMGGRTALFFLENFLPRIERCILLAPDGLKDNFFNWLVTNTKTGKNLYGFTIWNPGWVGVAASAGKNLGLLPPKIDKFLDASFGSKSQRLRIYRVWKLNRHIHFDLDSLSQDIKNSKVILQLVVGRKDPVVPPKYCKQFMKACGHLTNYHKIDAAHDLFKDHAVKYIVENVLNNSVPKT